MDLVIRPAAPDELRAASDAMRLALLNPTVGDEEWEKWKSGWEEDHLAITAWDGDRCVGHAGAFHFDTLVPVADGCRRRASPVSVCCPRTRAAGSSRR
jgi:hypothetical protein